MLRKVVPDYIKSKSASGISDVTLIAENGEKHHVHRIILALTSPFLKTIIEEQGNSNGCQEIEKRKKKKEKLK